MPNTIFVATITTCNFRKPTFLYSIELVFSCGTIMKACPRYSRPYLITRPQPLAFRIESKISHLRSSKHRIPSGVYNQGAMQGSYQNQLQQGYGEEPQAGDEDLYG